MTLTLLKKWCSRPPANYRPGATLLRALSDLHPAFVPVTVALSEGVLRTRNGEVHLTVHERVERHFQTHIVSLEVGVDVPARVMPGIRMEIRTTGFLSRTGVACAVPAKHREAMKGVVARIAGDRGVTDGLMQLDFRRCWLESSEEGWHVRIEPYGASEVVSQLPSFRRYIRLEERQSCALAAVMGGLVRVLSGQEGD